MITALGTGSGIDLESIVTQLMELERQPIRQLEDRRRRLDVELSAFGTVKSALGKLSGAAATIGDADSFGKWIASSSDEDVFTATSGDETVALSHEIEVESLATRSRYQSEAYADSTSTINQATHEFTSGDNSFEVVVDGTNDTLEGLRDAINNHADNTSMDAAILNVDGGARLVLTARIGGTDNEIQVNSTRNGLFGPAPTAFSELTAAEDAVIYVDGLKATRSSNVIDDVIDGVTLNLEGVGTATLSTERDTESISEGLQAFATEYNALRTELNRLAEGDLQGDRLTRNVESRLREIFSTPFVLTNGETVTPTEIGFTFDRYGKLSITESEITGADAADMQRFLEVMTRPDTGIAASFVSAVEEFTAADGLIDNREGGIGTQKSRIDDQIERLEYRLEKTETRLRKQYAAMDELVANLNNTSAYLASQLSALPNNNN